MFNIMVSEDCYFGGSFLGLVLVGLIVLVGVFVFVIFVDDDLVEVFGFVILQRRLCVWKYMGWMNIGILLERLVDGQMEILERDVVRDVRCVNCVKEDGVVFLQFCEVFVWNVFFGFFIDFGVLVVVCEVQIEVVKGFGQGFENFNICIDDFGVDIIIVYRGNVVVFVCRDCVGRYVCDQEFLVCDQKSR